MICRAERLQLTGWPAQTLKLYQIKRLALIQPDTSFTEALSDCQARCRHPAQLRLRVTDYSELSKRQAESEVSELLSEVSAELADLL